MPGLVEGSNHDGVRVLTLARPPVNAIDLDWSASSLKAETLRRLEEIVARDDDPMLRAWC
jgi:hypothetical protein